MGRPKRSDEAGLIYHMLNRANRRDTIFHKSADYEAFENILLEALDRVDLHLYSYCLMPNHWHLVVSPQIDGEMGHFGQWLGLTHTQRYHAHYHTTGDGHLYQGRHKSFPVQSDGHFLAVCRYVERNAFAAALCEEPDQWQWGSLWRWRHAPASGRNILTPWPIPRQRDWVDRVRTALSEKEERRLRRCILRNSPYGDPKWIE